MKMDKGAIFASMAIIALASVLVGAGTMAYFSDTETVSSPYIVAGNMDLRIFVTEFELTDIFPCKDLDPITFQFWNDGSIPGYLYYKVTYKQNDNDPNVKPLNADEFAALIYVKDVTYQHYTKWDTGWGWGNINTDEIDKWMDMDLNHDDYVSLYEMKKVGWMPYGEDILIPGDSGKFVITFHMADSLYDRVWDHSAPTQWIVPDVEDNAPQDDGIAVTFTALLKSSSGLP